MMSANKLISCFALSQPLELRKDNATCKQNMLIWKMKVNNLVCTARMGKIFISIFESAQCVVKPSGLYFSSKPQGRDRASFATEIASSPNFECICKIARETFLKCEQSFFVNIFGEHIAWSWFLCNFRKQIFECALKSWIFKAFNL